MDVSVCTSSIHQEKMNQVPRVQTNTRVGKKELINMDLRQKMVVAVCLFFRMSIGMTGCLG